MLPGLDHVVAEPDGGGLRDSQWLVLKEPLNRPAWSMQPCAQTLSPDTSWQRLAATCVNRLIAEWSVTCAVFNC